jgi:hypothetical protein
MRVAQAHHRRSNAGVSVGAEHRRRNVCRCLVSLLRMTSTVLLGVLVVCVA